MSRVAAGMRTGSFMLRDKFSELRVLIVDDSDHMRWLIRSIIESLGVRQVRDVENGMIALNDSRLNVPDVIITDMMMSPIDGLEFSRLLRDDVTHPATHVPVMMVTGHAEKQLVVAARDAGVTEFLAKPVTVDGVEARLRSVIENPRRFIRSESFAGPDRRRRQLPVAAEDRRRAEDRPANDTAQADDSLGVGATVEIRNAVARPAFNPGASPRPRERALR